MDLVTSLLYSLDIILVLFKSPVTFFFPYSPRPSSAVRPLTGPLVWPNMILAVSLFCIFFFFFFFFFCLSSFQDGD